jgi:ATP-binding cassette subfamily B protein
MPYILANIVDGIIKNSTNSTQNILINVVIVAIVLLMNPPMQILHVKLYSTAFRKVEKKLRQALLTKIETMSIYYYQKHQSGTLQSKIIRYVEGIEVLSEQFFIGFLTASENKVFALVIVIIKSRMVFLFFLLLVQFSLFFVVKLNSVIHKNNTSYLITIDKIASRVSELMELLTITRAHGLEDK